MEQSTEKCARIVEKLDRLSGMCIGVGLGTCRSGWCVDVSTEDEAFEFRAYGYQDKELALDNALAIMDGSFDGNDGCTPPCVTINGVALGVNDLPGLGPIEQEARK